MEKQRLHYYEQLAELYPTIGKASTEIINLQSILYLPKGTEHFLSDIHGEFKAFSENLGENIFHLDEDEVVLCLNYDGKFGLNNMNQYFQNANTNSKAFSWEEWSYKIGDRIIFTNTRRSTLLYNNLKGTIINISYAKKSIIFEIEVKAFLTEC